MDETPFEEAEHAVGMVFRLTRRRLRLSQRELAGLLGWDPSAVARWESGHVSVALGRVDGVLRGMGFRLAVVPLAHEDAQLWAAVEPPVEHIADRGFRRFPAHLDHEVVSHPPLHWWLRYRDKPNPMAPGWTYRKRRLPAGAVSEVGAAVAGATEAGATEAGETQAQPPPATAPDDGGTPTAG